MSDARASQNTERLPWIANENDSGGQSHWRGTRRIRPRVMAALSVAALLAGSGARLLDRDAQLGESHSAEDRGRSQGDNHRHSPTQETGFLARSRAT